MSNEDDFIPEAELVQIEESTSRGAEGDSAFVENRRELPVLDKMPRGDKAALVRFDGTVVTEKGNLVKHNWFSGIDIDSAAYSDIELTPTEARQLRTAHSRMKTGASAAAILTCYGPNICPMAKACQPPGTMVLTPDGYVAIEDLDPEIHSLVTYRRHGKLVLGLGGRGSRKYSFTKHLRHFRGQMIRITTSGDKSHECTPDHICIARWKPEAVGKFCVYLMRKGARYRVGRTKLFTEHGGQSIFGPASRARAEKADEVWILSTHNNLVEAHLSEEAFSCEWGLPKALFVASNGKDRKWDGVSAWVTQEQLDAHHTALSPGTFLMAERLEEIGMSIDHPIYTRSEQHAKGAKRIAPGIFNEIKACNLQSHLMEVVTFDGEEIAIEEIKISRRDYFGSVYSLDVEKYHTYIAQGIVTHNCPYVRIQREIDARGEQRRVVPLGEKCPVEIGIMRNAVERLATEYEIFDGEQNYTDQRFALELAEIEVMENRINTVLATDPDLQGFTEEKLVSTTTTKDGDVIDNYVKDVADLIKIREKLWARKDKIRKELVGTRFEQRKMAAKERDSIVDRSVEMAEILRRQRELLALVGKDD